MNNRSRLWAVLSYITWIGWLVAYLCRDKEDSLARRHLNQALVLNLISTVTRLVSRLGGVFKTITFIVDLAVLVLAIMGIVRASRGSEEPLPVIGGTELLK